MKRILLLAAASLTVGSMNAQTINVNGSMETWRSFTVGSGSLELPAGWYGLDSLIYASSIIPNISPQRMVFKDTTAANVYMGKAAAKITTHNQGSALGVVPGILANAKPVLSGFSVSSLTYAGGTPITQRVASVQARIKYAPQGADKGRMTVQTVLAGKGAGGKDSIIGSGDTLLSAMTAFTSVGVNLKYNGNTATPDKLLLIFMSSSAAGGTDGSTMWVDEVVASIFPAGVNDPKVSQAVSVYPNPAKTELFVDNTTAAPATINIYSIEGKLMLNKEVTARSSVNVSHLAAGTYHYQVLSHGALIKQDQLVIVK